MREGAADPIRERRISLRRTWLVVATAVLAGLAAAGGALAAGTTVTYSGSPGEGSKIEVADAPNRVLGLDVWEHAFRGLPDCGENAICIRDRSGEIAESSPHCTQPGSAIVRCKSNGLRSLEVASGNGADRIVIMVANPLDLMAVRSGRGNDVVQAIDMSPFVFPLDPEMFITFGAGRDRGLIKGAGTMRGGGGGDRLRGGRGPQRLFGNKGNDTLSCGKGRDFGDGGPGNDRGFRGCERVRDEPNPPGDSGTHE